jgi:L-alanine-DL-glutamate epimerase-like enolase superfamily enzyme
MPSPFQPFVVRDAQTSFEHHTYRTPIKFGGAVMDRITILNVRLIIEFEGGFRSEGFGSMPLSHVWAFPSRIVPPDSAAAAMRELAECAVSLLRELPESVHPVDCGLAFEERLLASAAAVSERIPLAEPLPKLATLVVGSAFDAALHDAFGKAFGVNAFLTYGRDFMPNSLSCYLGETFADEWLADYLLTRPVPTLPLESADVAQPVGDGLPETLADWIVKDGLTHFKIKLNGDDFAWDFERVVAIDAVATRVQSHRGVQAWWYSLDFNERCQSVDYLVELLCKLRERTIAAYDRVQYVEQPTGRDLRANLDNKMHRAAALKPVVIDESLTDLESLYLARDLGYSGAALKACKGQSQSLLLAAAIRKLGMFLCVQDLTCPGASLIHSASLAAHIPGVAAIEANARQYCPKANAAWEKRFPGIFEVRNGVLDTSGLDAPGIGAV